MFDNKTGREIKLLVGHCSVCNRKNSMIVSDNAIQAEGFGDFFKNLDKSSIKVGKKLAKNVLKSFTSLGYYSELCYCSCK